MCSLGKMKNVNNNIKRSRPYPVPIKHPVGPVPVAKVGVLYDQPQFTIVRLGLGAEQQRVVKPRLLTGIHVEKWTLERF